MGANALAVAMLAAASDRASNVRDMTLALDEKICKVTRSAIKKAGASVWDGSGASQS